MSNQSLPCKRTDERAVSQPNPRNGPVHGARRSAGWQRRTAAFCALAFALLWATCAPATPAMEQASAAAAMPQTDRSSAAQDPSRPATQAASPGMAYYVRPDGGSHEQCTGRADAPYPGSGTGRACAWDHPFRALPPDERARISGGDTLIVGPGEYMMGYGAPGADGCEADSAYDCHMSPVPGGPDAAHPTRILGTGWDRGCLNPPELWGTERAWLVVNLEGSSHVEVACFEITDHSSCVEDHVQDLGGSGWTCERENPPFGPWADTGLSAADSEDVTLRHLNIHGLAVAGVRAGRLTDWLVEDTRIAANGWVGWEGDIDGEDANSGTLTFRRWTVEWNGCAETWPGDQPTACWAQPAGGYGDGIGTGATGGDWIIEDSAILHNTQDGLDLLYHSLGGRVVLDRVRAEGNAGNQVKVAGRAEITNSVLVGNCAFFEGQPFSYGNAIDHCRASGNTLEFAYTGGEQSSIVHSTIYGQGDGLVGGGPREGYTCNGSETLLARNSIFRGDTDYFDPGDITFAFYQERCGDLELDSDYNVIHRAKNVECGGDGEYVRSGAHDLCQDPQLAGPLSGMAYGMILAAGSPAIDAADDARCLPVDILGVARPVDGDDDGVARCDMGAYEYSVWEPTAWIYLPAVLRLQVGGL
jgi:hypothetical protein